MRTIYLQRSLTINGRGALGGRRLVDRLRDVSEDVLVGHMIASEDYAQRADASVRQDIISEVELIKFAPNVIFLEGGFFAGSGFWRIDQDLAREFVERGGALIVADADLNTLRQQRLDYYEAVGFLGAAAAYRDKEPVAGYDEKSYWRGTKQILCNPEDMIISEWLKPIYEGIPQILCGLPVRLTSFSDLLASGNQHSTWSDATDGIPGPDNLPFASVRKSGAGFVVFIAASVTGDAWLEGCPHNTNWLVNTAQFLTQAAQTDRRRTGSALKSEDNLFLSHAAENKQFVESVYSILGREHNVGAWIDRQELIPGDSLPSHIESAIRNASTFVLFWSGAAAESAWVRRELALALEREEFSPLIIRLDETPVPDQFANLLRIEGVNEEASEIARQILRSIERRQVRTRIDKVRKGVVPPAPSEAAPAPPRKTPSSSPAGPLINIDGNLPPLRRVADIGSNFRIDILSFILKPGSKASDGSQAYTLVSGSSDFNEEAVRSALEMEVIDGFRRVHCQTGMDGHLDCHEASARYLLYGYETVQVMDCRTHEVVATIECEDNANVCSAAWNLAGDRIVVGSTNYLTLADDRGNVLLHKNMYSSRGGAPLSVAWQTSANLAYTSADRVVIADPQGQVVRELEELNSTATAVALSPDGRLIAACSLKGEVVIWSESGDVVGRLKGIQSSGRTATRCLAFSPDSRYLAQAACLEGEGFLLADLKEGKTARIPLPEADLLAFHPVSPLLAVAADETITFWELPPL